MAVRPDLTSAWGGIEVASDGHPAHFYFYDFCIDSDWVAPEASGSQAPDHGRLYGDGILPPEILIPSSSELMIDTLEPQT